MATIKVEVKKRSYQRWKVVEGTQDRVLMIDFRAIRSVEWKPVDYGGQKMSFETVEQMKAKISEYFESCFGVLTNPKTGQPMFDSEGRPRLGQIKPFTIAGLAYHLGITTKALKKYANGHNDYYGFPDEYVEQYSTVIQMALQRIEAYAEERIYDKEGFAGGKLVLNSVFRWQEQLEKAQINNMRAQNMFKAQELQFKKDTYEAEEGSNEPITIRIERAQKRVGEEDNDE